MDQKEYPQLGALEATFASAQKPYTVDTLANLLNLFDAVEKEAGENFDDYPFARWQRLEYLFNAQFIQLEDEVASSLGGGIASTAEDLFPSEEAREQAFEHLIQTFLKEYGNEASTERSENVVTTTRLSADSDWWAKTKIELLENGAVIVAFDGKGKSTPSHAIVPIDAGFINHDFSIADTYLPKAVVQQYLDDRKQLCRDAGITEEEASFWFGKKYGWLATTSTYYSRMQRTITKGEQYRSLRIGYKIYAQGVLETIRKIKAAYPQYWESESDQ